MVCQGLLLFAAGREVFGRRGPLVSIRCTAHPAADQPTVDLLLTLSPPDQAPRRREGAGADGGVGRAGEGSHDRQDSSPPLRHPSTTPSPTLPPTPNPPPTTQIVLVTEPIFGSLHNVITSFRDVPTAPESAQSTQLSQLEFKYGLMHLAETLQFLHAEARLAHSNVNPETVLICKDGSWKLAGFAFVGSAEGYGSGGGAGGAALTFEFSGAGGGLPLWDEVMQVRGERRARLSTSEILVYLLGPSATSNKPLQSLTNTSTRPPHPAPPRLHGPRADRRPQPDPRLGPPPLGRRRILTGPPHPRPAERAAAAAADQLHAE